VSKYHQHQAKWSKDTFLKRVEGKKGLGREPGRWGGMATYAPEPIKYFCVIRRPSSSKKPSQYVIPSQKDRRDVIWEIRNRLAVIDRL
jgi:hypothetical protein